MKRSSFQVRQGDLYLIQIDALPNADPVLPSRPQVILAEGEMTGHAHYLTVEEAIQFKPTDRLRRIAEEFGITDTRALVGGLRVRVDGATLWHGTPTANITGPRDADHDPIALPIGDYLVIQPREYSDEDEFRRIAD